MAQQINLLTALRGELDGGPTGLMIVQVAVGSIVLLILVAILSDLSASAHDGDLEQRTLALDELTQELQQLRKAHGIRETDPELEERLATLKRNKESKTILLGNLSATHQGTKTGFTRYLRGLARRRVDGLWLTSINFSQGGQALSLKGLSLRPEYVPLLLQELKNEPSFRGQEFNGFKMTRTEENSGDIEFLLSSYDTVEQGKKRE